MHAAEGRSSDSRDRGQKMEEKKGCINQRPSASAAPLLHSPFPLPVVWHAGICFRLAASPAGHLGPFSALQPPLYATGRNRSGQLGYE